MNSCLKHIYKVFFSSKFIFYIYPVFKLIIKDNEKREVFLKKIIDYYNKFTIEAVKNVNHILILLPHCLQNDKCIHRISGTNIFNCKSCGACDIGNIIKSLDINSIGLFVASGGTVARKIIKETKPDFIIAVACENDLVSGVKDVKKYLLRLY